MRTRDLILAGLFSLRRQKLRTTLTALGVTIGIATLVASVSVGIGVRQIVEDQFKREKRLREITVYPGYDQAGDEFEGVPADVLQVEGDVPEQRRERIRKHLAQVWKQLHFRPAPKPLTPDRLRAFASWDHVVAVEPDLFETVRVGFQGQVVSGQCAGFTGEPDQLPAIMEFGRPPSAGAAEAIVHEFMLYQAGVRSDAEIKAGLGQVVRVELDVVGMRRPEAVLALFDADLTKLSEDELRAMAKARDLLPDAVQGFPGLSADEKASLQRALGRKRKKDPAEREYAPESAEFRIVGVFRDPDRKKDRDLMELFVEGLNAEVVIPRDQAEAFFGRAPVRQDRGYTRAVLTVDADENLKPVCDRLKAEGHHFFSIGLFLQQARKNVLLIGFTMDFVALLALAVACLGIMNTMFTAVLERTREIGVMKAVGAKDRHVLVMFLVEGALIGLVGGWLGVLIGWAVSFPGDNVALGLIREQEPTLPTPETVFRYPLWLVFGAPAFAVLVTTLAGLLPARRAARVEPVVALRAE